MDSKITSSKNINKKKDDFNIHIVDKTQLKAYSELIWLWIEIESKNKLNIALSISKDRNLYVAIECFMSLFLKNPDSRLL